jgi:hypothetical protein
VDNSEQLLNERRKSLIFKEIDCDAHKIGSQAQSPAAHEGTLPVPQYFASYPCLHWTMVWITMTKPCMAALSP